MNEGKILLVKGIAGLGNRMRCALTGILYARLTGRKLIIDWSDDTYSQDGSNVFHRFFQCSLCGPTDEIPATDSIRPSVWRGHLHECVRNMKKPYRNNTEFWQATSIDLTKLDYQEDIVVLWTFDQRMNLLRDHFTGAFEQFAQASTEAIVSKLLREDLRLHPQIRERVEQFKSDNFSKKTVGVHVRYTDHRVRLWAILKKLNTLLQHEPELQIFLSTDNVQIKNLFEESYPGVISTPHWYPTAGRRLHGIPNRLDLIENGIDALVDLYLLAECDSLIIDTSSSFSYLAKVLTKTANSHIFDVKQRGKLSVPVRRLTWRLMISLRVFSWGLSLVSKFVKIQKLIRW
jgi:hypothetical protein